MRSKLTILMVFLLVFRLPAFSQRVHVGQYGMGEGLISPDVTAIAEDARGVFWVGTSGGGRYNLVEGRFIEQDGLNREVGYDISALSMADDGSLVITSSKGSFIFDGYKVIGADARRTPVKSPRLPITAPDLQVWCMETGDLGEIWLGTSSGLYSYRPVDSFLLRIDDTGDLLRDTIRALLYDRNNLLWIGTSTNGLLRYDGLLRTSVPLGIDQDIREITTANSGINLLLATSGEVYRESAPGSREYVLCAPPGIHAGYFTGTIAASWLIDDQGRIFRFKDEWFYRVGRENGKNTWVFVTQSSGDEIIAENRRGEVYSLELYNIGTDSTYMYREIRLPGLSFKDEPIGWISRGLSDWYRIGSHSVAMTERSETSSRQIYYSDSAIRSFTPSSDGYLWLGTADGRIIRLREDGTVSNLQLPKSLDPYPINFLHISGSVIWAGTDRHVWQLQLSEDQQRAVQMHARYTGSRGSLTAGSFSVGPDLMIRVITGDEILEFRAQGYTPVSSAPTVYISGIILEDGQIQSTEYMETLGGFLSQREVAEFPYQKSNIGFSFDFASHLPVNQKILFSWRMDGVHPDWSSLSESRSVWFAGLKPGAYRFETRACNQLGVCSSTPATWDFVVKPPIWHHWWFWLIATGVLGGALTWLVNRRVRIVRQQEVRKRETLATRLKALELEQKALQLQMNPHFIFNALQTISTRVGVDEDERVKEAIVHFSRLMRSMLNISRSDRVSLDEEISFLQNYVQVHNLGRSEPVELNVDLQHGIEPFDIEMPPMMLQPLIENSIKYGASKIDLSVALKEQYVVISVTDNGPGMDQKMPVDTDGNKSVALGLIRSRLEGMKGDADFQIFDMVNGSGEVTGVRAILMIPHDPWPE